MQGGGMSIGSPIWSKTRKIQKGLRFCICEDAIAYL